MNSGSLDPDVLDRAEQAVAALSGQYRDWAAGGLDQLRLGMTQMRTDGQDCPVILRRMYGIAHDMKGQASTFGYPLLARIAQGLCRLLDEPNTPPPGVHGLEQMDILIGAIATVLDNELKGDGGAHGQSLMRKLEP